MFEIEFSHCANSFYVELNVRYLVLEKVRLDISVMKRDNHD